MKTINVMLLLASLTFTATFNGQTQETLPFPSEKTPTNAVATPPIFGRFVTRLQSCTGLFAHVNQWFKVMKPALEELGYTRAEIKEIRAKLGAHKATMPDAHLFTERWLRKHGEQLDPVLIFNYLPHDQTAEPALAAK